MLNNKIHFYKNSAAVTEAFAGSVKADDPARLEPATCTEAEPFALRVLDDSMQPEFRKGCIIVIDPTGRATDGSFVLARDAADNFIFRQLRRHDQGWSLVALNDGYPSMPTDENLSALVGIIVQRAGVRRSYHKHYG